MSTPEQMARAFARKYPTPRSHPNGGDLNWDQDCGAFASRICLEYGSEPTGDVRSAWIVWQRTPTAGTDPAAAPAGAWHFYDIGGPENGHVQWDLVGGGTRVVHANAVGEQIEGAVNIRITSVAQYLRERPAARYVGWTTSYANGNTGVFDVPRTSPTASAGGTTPITSNTGEDDMSISFVKDAQSATIFVCSVDNGRRVGIQSPYHMTLLQRYRKNNADDPMLVGELDIVRAYLVQLDEPANVQPVLAALKNIAINPADVRAAVKAALSEGIELTAEVPDEQLDAAAERFAKLLGIRLAGGDLAGA